MPMGASVWMVWATTPANVPCSMLVSWAGWVSWTGPDSASVGGSPGPATRPSSGKQLCSLPGRTCEQLVDFCSPDLNPCQHEAQCVGTPDGPRLVSPVARARTQTAKAGWILPSPHSLVPPLSGETRPQIDLVVRAGVVGGTALGQERPGFALWSSEPVFSPASSMRHLLLAVSAVARVR